MMIGSGWLKSTPENVAPTWNSPPPTTSPGEPPLQLLPLDQASRQRLYVVPLNVCVPFALREGLFHGFSEPPYAHDMIGESCGVRNVSRKRCAVWELGLTRSQLCIVWIDSPTLLASSEKSSSLTWRRQHARCSSLTLLPAGMTWFVNGSSPARRVVLCSRP